MHIVGCFSVGIPEICTIKSLLAQTEQPDLLVLFLEECLDPLSLEGKLFTKSMLSDPISVPVHCEASTDEVISLDSIFKSAGSYAHSKLSAAVEGMTAGVRICIHKALEGVQSGSPDIYLLAELNYVLAALKRGVHVPSAPDLNMEMYKTERQILKLAESILAND